MASKRYSLTATLLHWLVAALVLIQIGLGFGADWSERPQSDYLLDQHVRVGVLLLALVVLRLLWRLGNAPPPLPDFIPLWQRRAAGITHPVLYLLLLLMPITGYVLWAWTGPPLDWWGLGSIPILFVGGDDEFWRSVAGYVHEYGAYAITGLVLIHILAALWHAFIARDLSISERMGFGALDHAGRAD
jgi:cytochrome b561